MSNFIPNEIKKIVPRDPPWIDRNLKSMLKKKDKHYRNYKKHGYREEDKATLEALRTECKESIETAKKLYLKKLADSLNDATTTPKSYWKIIYRIMNKTRAPKIPPLLDGGTFIINCKEKAKLFNDFFSKQCTLIINESILPDFHYITEARINSIEITRESILAVIRSLNPNKATGCDEISGQMLRICDESVVMPLMIIFNNILECSVYPDQWKLANVVPIHKKEDKQLVKNYRPISLLPICGKIFEKLIFDGLYLYLVSNNLITKNQSGFVPGDSCTNQLLFLINEIHEAFEDPKSLEVRAVFLDISKAFDKVWHDGLIFKLRQNGVSGKLLNFFQSYLSNRKQRVAINGFYSEFADIESGVPQGSVLGPLLFLVYINDLEKDIKSNVKFFADDTMLYSIVKDPTQSASDLNHDLEKINQWANQWKMAFNPDPNKQANEVLFSCKTKSVDHPQIFFNGFPVVQVKETKHLGLILQFKLNFEKHLFEKMKKAKRIIGMIKHLNYLLPLKTLNQMYKSLVRPHLDYCDIIYHIPQTVHPQSVGGGITLNCHMERVEQIQYQAALAVTGAWQGSDRVKLYEELGWETLNDRRMLRRILQLHKIVDGKTPSYLRQSLPQMETKSSKFFPALNLPNQFPTKYGTDRYLQSFFPDATKNWNCIITDFRELPSFEELKKHLISLYRPITKPTFNIHNSALRYIFQLRLGLSHLRHHKKRHNFADTPSDVCLCKGGIEDTRHFLTSCTFYITHREILIACVESILIKYDLTVTNFVDLLLYGHSSLSDTENANILLATLEFITKTKRFAK